jgi:hypothetical protein
VQNALTGFNREVRSQDDGSYSVSNIPFNNYVVLISADGFAASLNEVALRTNVPQTLSVQLSVAAHNTRVDVSAYESAALVQPEATGTKTELNAAAIERMPIAPNTRGLESVLLSMPGFAANANGAIHPRGAHNQMSYIIDGMPVTDQLTGSFANAVDPSIVQTIELYTGNVPAEYGSKISGVASITTRSGVGSGRSFGGSTQVSGDSFDTLGQITQVAGGNDRFGYFASVNTIRSNRYLDQVSLDNLHNGGNSERGFARLDYHAGPKDQLRLNLLSGRSSFQLANLRSQHANGQDQRQLLKDLSASVGWLHTIDARTTVDSMVSYRTAVAQLFGSAGDTPVTATQDRHLTTVTIANRWNRIEGRHTLRGGVDWQHFPVSENFTFAITHPAFNEPGAPGYNPSLAAHDLTRGGVPFYFSDKQSGNQYSAFVQDNIKLGAWVVSLGLRYDNYRFLAVGNQLQPRVGIAYHIDATGTVLRASYNRTYQTSPNENLLLSSSPEAEVLVPPAVKEALGGGVVIIRPERQNVYEVGLQQAIGNRLSLNGSYYHKDSTDMQDNDNFFNTGIIFPTSLAKSRTNGAEARLTLLPVKRLSGSLSLTHYRTIVTPPFTGGLFLGSSAIDLLTAGPFVIDHSQELAAHGMVQYSVRRDLWLSSSIRYDSGLVSNPSDPAVVAQDPDYYDLLPYVNLTANPPRVKPRVITDIAVGYEFRSKDRVLWDLTAQVSNLTNETALYNFQSIFVGTRLVQPRTAALKFRVHF